MTETNTTTAAWTWELGDPVWWSPATGERYSGTVLRHDEQGYLVTLHDHPEWRWVEQVPAGQLVDRDETPELVVTTTESGITVMTWNCPHPSHVAGPVSGHGGPRFGRESCARYMPPFGHAHDTVYPPELLPDGVDPATVPVWIGGIAPAAQTGGAS